MHPKYNSAFENGTFYVVYSENNITYTPFVLLNINPSFAVLFFIQSDNMSDGLNSTLIFFFASRQ